MFTEGDIALALNLAQAGFIRSPFDISNPFFQPIPKTTNSSEKPIDQNATHYKEQIVPRTGEVILVIDNPSISQTTLPSRRKQEKKS